MRNLLVTEIENKMWNDPEKNKKQMWNDPEKTEIDAHLFSRQKQFGTTFLVRILV